MTDNAHETTDTPPDHLSIDPKSPFFNEAILDRGIGIRFNGVEKTNVEEYNVKEGWVRVSLGKSVDRKGNPMTMKLKGVVEPYFRDTAD
ncbi:MAG: glutathione peroxidase [Acidocella sp. 35-58-6]|nr:MAG: glutathione peroxidase [Acidocella sp. 35-58-6]